ncbi:hypothetical protein SAMN04488500_11197 [Sporomusa malonica]|uniref:Uncharacterized protein n=1 Tax=Sporomusa malonica TaxID=112901 RepID=A0A1W2CTW7_9FIRM|nr:hypothetical protein SAMN04488500_11197 [Sporomusa malonica]
MQRRRSKHFVKLSGKRTVTGLYSGEHIRLFADVTDGEPCRGKSLRYNGQRQRELFRFASVFYFVHFLACMLAAG